MKKFISILMATMFIIVSVSFAIDKTCAGGWVSNTGQKSAPGGAYDITSSPDGGYSFYCAGGGTCFEITGPNDEFLHINEAPGHNGQIFIIEQNR